MPTQSPSWQQRSRQTLRDVEPSGCPLDSTSHSPLEQSCGFVQVPLPGVPVPAMQCWTMSFSVGPAKLRVHELPAPHWAWVQHRAPQLSRVMFVKRMQKLERQALSPLALQRAPASRALGPFAHTKPVNFPATAFTVHEEPAVQSRSRQQLSMQRFDATAPPRSAQSPLRQSVLFAQRAPGAAPPLAGKVRSGRRAAGTQ